MFEKIIILNYNATNSIDLVKQLRNINVYCEVYSHNVDVNLLKDDQNIKGIILNSLNEDIIIDDSIFTLNIPILLTHNINLNTFSDNIYTDFSIEEFIKICNLKEEYTLEKFIQLQIQQIQDTVKDDKVLLGISGGVDSTVCAYLLSEAIGDNLTCMFIDHGLLRKNEANEVMQSFNDLDINVVKVDARDEFLDALKGITDPEEKRKIIGKTFIDVFNKESQQIDDFKYLAQGTLYTDILESGELGGSFTKSHHNVGGLPKDLDFEIIEPFRKLFKDEVRKIGFILNLPEKLINRQPFPGPGLAIRIIGDVTKEKLVILKETDFILRETFQKYNLDKEVWQYFTVLTNIKSVGVTKGKRSYDYTVAIRAVNSIDGSSSSWARIPFNVLDEISTKITSNVSGVNRVVYDITSKPPATIEWE